MILSFSRCCHNLTPPPQLNPSTSTSKSSHSKQSHLTRPESQLSQRSWRSGCLALGAAAAVIMINNFDGGINMDEQQLAGAAHAWVLQDASKSRRPPAPVEVQKWSDKRICPPWRLNSLETIVPENLPRPFTRRRWQTVESIPDHASSSHHHDHQLSSQKMTSKGKDLTSQNQCFLL